MYDATKVIGDTFSPGTAEADEGRYLKPASVLLAVGAVGARLYSSQS